MRKIIFLLMIFFMFMQVAQAELSVTDTTCDVTLDARYGDAKARDATVTLTLKNTGNASMTVYAPSLRVSESGINLTKVTSFPVTIASGASKEVRIKVRVAGTVSEGTYLATADFSYGSGTITINVDRLIPAHLAPLPNIDAGTGVFDGQEKEIKKVNFQIINDGDTTMTLRSVAAYGNPEAGMTFNVDHPSQISEQSAGTATLMVTIPATAPDGKHQGRLRIDAGKAGSQTITVTVTIEHIAAEQEAIVELGGIEIRGEVVDATVQIAPFTWTGQNFAGLHYDVDRNIMSEALTTTVTMPDAIASGDLVYTTHRVESNYANHEIGEYFEIWWFGEKYMAINGKPYVISPVIMEMDKYDKKTLATGEEWYLGNGYSLIAEQIDLDANEVRLTLNKDGGEFYSSIIRLYDQGDWFNNCMSISGSLGEYTITTEDVRTERTFVYQAGAGSEADVPVFSVYVDAIFRGTTTNIVQLKCATLIDDNLVSVINDGAGILDVQTVTPESVRLESDRDISLDPNSDVHIAESLWLRVAGDLDGNSVQNYRYYPYISHECPEPEPEPTPTPTPTPVNEVVEIRGEVVEANGRGQLRAVGSAGAYADTHTWNPYNFAAFYYDPDNDAGSEALTLYLLTGADNRIIAEDRLIYTTTPVPRTYAIVADGVADSLGTVNGSPVTQYFIEGFLAEKYVAISTGGSTMPHGNKLAKRLVEFESSSDKKTLSEGEAWNLGSGFTLTAGKIDLEGDRVWLTLSKDGKELDNEVIDTSATGDRMYMYTADLSGVEDVVVCSCYVDAIFRGTDSNIVQLKYVFLIDNEVLEVRTGDTYGEMEVTTASASGITLKNDGIIDLSRDGDCNIEIMDDMFFRVADSDTVRFYPCKVYTEPGDYEIRGTVVEANDSSWIYPVGTPSNIGTGYTWNSYNFAAFYYDPDDDLLTEQLAIEELRWYDNRTIAEDKLVYSTTPVPQTYAIVDDGVASGLGIVSGNTVTQYFIEGWMGEKYVAISTGGSTTPHGNKLSKLLVEFEGSDKKTLLVGEAWDLGGGFTLTAQQINLEGDRVWLSLAKDGKELDSEVLDTGDSGDRVYMYTADLSGVEDVVVCSCYVDAVFRGTDSNIVQLKYVFLIDNDVLVVSIGETYGDMKVTTASASGITLRNDCDIDLRRNSNVWIMQDMLFRVADNNTLRFYPYAEYTIHEAFTPPPTPTAFS